MTRNAYLGTLAILQAAVMWQALPAVVAVLQRQIPLGTATGMWTSSIQLGAALVCILAAALVLAFPTIALFRHCEHGPHRFVLLPTWAVGMAFGGAVLFGASVVLRTLLDASVELSRTTLMPLVLTGFALMHAGALAAELLRANPAVRTVERIPRPQPDEIPDSSAAWRRALEQE